ncbi:MAG: TraB/GumN family protein [Ferruginibacter sp.]
MNLMKLFAGLVIMCSCKAQHKSPDLPIQKNNNTLLWEVTGKNVKTASYIFGTFHLMCKDDIHFSPALLKAVQFADTVYMELDMDDPSIMLGGMMMMNMKDGKKLKDFYTESEYKRLSDFFKDSIGVPIVMMQSMKPSMLEALLYPKMLACNTSTGVDMELMALAKKDKKEINGLETLAFQASVFDSIPYEEQAKGLLKAIDSLDDYKKDFDSIVQVYKSQRIDDIERMLAKGDFGDDMEANGDVLLYNRNRNWIKQLKQIMAKENVFVAVGAGHLVGDKGLIALLKKEGYTVRPVLNQ